MNFSPLEGVQHRSLDNGLRALVREDRSLPLVSLHVWVGVGSVDEKEHERGLSHFLEHMLFKGTPTRSAREIARFVEGLGGAMNAETSKEYTHYFLDLPAEGFDKGLELLSEIATQATFPPEEVERERRVVLEEMKRRDDEPDTLLWDLLVETLLPDTAYRWPVIGSKNTIRSQTRADLAAFYHAFYVPNNMAVVAVGDVAATYALDAIEKYFGSPRPGRLRERPSLRQSTYKPAHRRLQKDVQQCYVAFALPTPPMRHPDQEPLDVLACILGEGRSARLYRRLREEKPLVWSVSAMNVTQEGTGLFVIWAECDKNKTVPVEEEIGKLLSEMESSQRSAFQQNELQRAITMFESAWVMDFETFHNQAAVLGRYAIQNELERLAEYLPRIRAVTREDLARLHHAYLRQTPFSTARVEPQ